MADLHYWISDALDAMQHRPPFLNYTPDPVRRHQPTAIGSGAKPMKTQRLLVVLTVINLGLLVFLLAQTRVHIGAQGVRVWTNIDGSVLRGRALEIIDDQGRPRAAINLHPADPTGSYPETAILRLIDQNGRPSVKLSISERGGALALVSDAEGTYVQLSGRGLTVTKDGRPQAVP
jgi:hypothetical protein